MVSQFHKKMRHESALQINHARNISRSSKKITDSSSTTALDPRVPQLQEQLSFVAESINMRLDQLQASQARIVEMLLNGDMESLKSSCTDGRPQKSEPAGPGCATLLLPGATSMQTRGEA